MEATHTTFTLILSHDRTMALWGPRLHEPNIPIVQGLCSCHPPSLLSPYLRISDSLMEAAVSPLKVKSFSRVQLFSTPWTVAYQAVHPWNFPGKNTGVGCHFLLQEIFPTQGLNPGLPHCRQTLYCLSHQGSPKSRYQRWRPPGHLESHAFLVAWPCSLFLRWFSFLTCGPWIPLW